jgi:hypothetical protein
MIYLFGLLTAAHNAHLNSKSKVLCLDQIKPEEVAAACTSTDKEYDVVLMLTSTFGNGNLQHCYVQQFFSVTAATTCTGIKHTCYLIHTLIVAVIYLIFVHWQDRRNCVIHTTHQHMHVRTVMCELCTLLFW